MLRLGSSRSTVLPADWLPEVAFPTANATPKPRAATMMQVITKRGAIVTGTSCAPFVGPLRSDIQAHFGPPEVPVRNPVRDPLAERVALGHEHPNCRARGQSFVVQSGSPECPR